MTDQQLTRVSLAAGVVASASVGVPVLLEQLLGSGDLIGPYRAWWWSAYLVHLGVFLGYDLAVARLPWLDGRWLLAVQIAAGLAAVALAPTLGFTSVLLVISAASAAYVLSPLGAGGVVVFQSVATAVWLATGSWHGLAAVPPLEVVLISLVYASFQGFATLVVIGQRRETAAREELAEVNAELQAATALLAANSRNDERLRIARELHDLVGHQLTALALNLEAASHQHGEEQQRSVARARAMAKDLLGDVRDAVGDLRHPVPSLRAALESVAVRVPRPRVHLDVDDDLPLEAAQAAAIVRCVQEVVTNAVRHSDADNLWVSVCRDAGGGLEVRARDDGRGAEQVRAGNGLTGMAERLAKLGGELTYSAAPAEGFRLRARVPAAAPAP
ncbi:sensor histidine kinase [Egicoccus sp. AB-alg6-2]|uniref:sensor histidine kinase n=1 Tax=Egicoccus sp. AB-alg6-2 TaxID=3242692 RepID=UPI00359EA1DF